MQNPLCQTGRAWKKKPARRYCDSCYGGIHPARFSCGSRSALAQASTAACGKVEAGKTVAGAATRELEDDAGVRVCKDLQQLNHLTFLFPATLAWNQMVHVFLATRWKGRPTESAEMRPAWFPYSIFPLRLNLRQARA